VINLVDNAIKYNRPGGSVKLSARAEGHSVIVQVSDTGIGLSQEDLPHVFDRFFRVDKSRSREQGGSGLGLAIVKKIVEDHGGTVSVESVVGEGSMFSIALPELTE
jgi:signal transduction histidine kinase